MSLGRLEKFINKTENKRCKGEKIRSLLVVGDSKVRYVKETANSDIEKSILWYTVGGLTTLQATKWIYKNIDKIIKEEEYVDICLWTGTCDITDKVGRYIYPSTNKSAIEATLNRYRELRHLKLKYGVRVSFIIFEVPYFSVSLWNKSRGHRNPTQFYRADRVVEKSIRQLNTGIIEINELFGTSSPKFSIDLIQTRKTKSKRCKKSSFHNYKLLKNDGVHPSNVLALYWMRKIQNLAIRESYI